MEQRRIEDELDKIHIDQLHKATLKFSEQSLETKKLCVTIVIGVFTLVAAFYDTKSGNPRMVLESLRLFGTLIPFLFLIVDAIMYYYQEKLRFTMKERVNNIRTRNQLKSFTPSRGREGRIVRSIFNGANFIYLGLILISLILPTILISII